MTKSQRFTLALFLSIAVGGAFAPLLALGQAIPPRPSATPTSDDAEAENDQQLPSDYVIGPEDVLGVLVWREQEMSGDVTVRSDGMITLPLVGDLPAAGLSPEELAGQIETVSADYLTDPNVTVSVRQINSRKAFITGEVASPGAYSLSGPLTVTQLIAMAGGLMEWADQQKISIIRVEEDGRTEALTFNYKWIKEGRRLEQNILLKTGDTVVVP